MDGTYCIILVTCKKPEEALHIQEFLVKEQLASSADMVENVTSSFTWRFKIDKAARNLLILKTKTSLIEKAIKRIKELSKETPEVIALPVIAGDADYLKHIDETTL